MWLVYFCAMDSRKWKTILMLLMLLLCPAITVTITLWQWDGRWNEKKNCSRHTHTLTKNTFYIGLPFCFRSSLIRDNDTRYRSPPLAIKMRGKQTSTQYYFLLTSRWHVRISGQHHVLIRFLLKYRLVFPNVMSVIAGFADFSYLTLSSLALNIWLISSFNCFRFFECFFHFSRKKCI